MSLRYSFIGQDFDIVFSNAGSIFPGIQKMLAIYYEEDSGQIIAKKCEDIGNNPKIEYLNIIDDLKRVNSLRREKLRTQWISSEYLPFEVNTKSNTKKGLFKEFDNISLLLRFYNSHDQLNDILILYFQNNQGNFGIGKSDQPLTADNKSVIESLAFNIFNTLISNSRNDRMIHQRINTDTGSFIKDAQSKQEELDFTKNNYRQSIANLCIHYMKELSVKSGKDYQLSAGALRKLQDFEGEISNLSKILENSVIYIENTLIDPEIDKISINEWQINLSHYQSKAETKFSIKIFEEKYRRTIEFLDMLETAADRVKKNQHKLTSANVGNACSNVMSAPGITDKLSNHAKKIHTLFNKYPEKWILIRNDFRPVQNLIISWEKKVHSQYKGMTNKIQINFKTFNSIFNTEQIINKTLYSRKQSVPLPLI